MQNIRYQTEELRNFYSRHRITWDQLYPSEKVVFEYLDPESASTVLDMGCACGGLGLALKERFGITHYIGVDINRQCIDAARALCPWGTFRHGDFLDISSELPRNYDFAVSLSCADWNVRTEELLSRLYTHVRDAGYLVFSCRVSNDPKVADVLEASQKIHYSDAEVGEGVERSPYKVYRVSTIMRLLVRLGPISQIYGYGYWGPVPKTVSGLPVREVFFIVFAVRKGNVPGNAAPRLRLDIDVDLLFEQPIAQVRKLPANKR